ncbi:hypothetical protein AAEU42_10905 [Pseudoflavonifractor phocaeensis]|uniref:hypothetical protein n=1 Tax=Pseudoflavonifractor phocaeensis TaxID=1870988 RepID=UPI00313E337D
MKAKRSAVILLLSGVILVLFTNYYLPKKPPDPFAELCASSSDDLPMGFIRNFQDAGGGYYFVFDDLAGRLISYSYQPPADDQEEAKKAADPKWSFEIILTSSSDLQQYHFSVLENEINYRVLISSDWISINGVLYKLYYAADLEESCAKWWTYYKDHQDELICEYVFPT